MNIETKYFGTAESTEDDIIRFNSGLPGFSDEQAFIFLPLEKESPFIVIQSVTTPSLAFVSVSPFLLFEDYDITINDQTVESLKIESENDAAVYVILTVREPFETSTANLIAPVLVNHKTKMGKQIVLENSTYGINHTILHAGTQSKKEGDHHARTETKTK